MYGSLKNINHMVFKSQCSKEKLDQYFSIIDQFLNGTDDLAIIDAEQPKKHECQFQILGSYRVAAIRKILDDEARVAIFLRSHQIEKA